MLTRQHYKAIASIIKEELDPSVRVRVARKLAVYFNTDNSRFDPEKFMIACNAGKEVEYR